MNQSLVKSVLTHSLTSDISLDPHKLNTHHTLITSLASFLSNFCYFSGGVCEGLCCDNMIWVKRFQEVKTADFYLSDPNYTSATHPNGPQVRYEILQRVYHFHATFISLLHLWISIATVVNNIP